MAATRIVLTYADYAALPDDGRRYEIREGKLSVTTTPGTKHQEVTGNRVGRAPRPRHHAGPRQGLPGADRRDPLRLDGRRARHRLRRDRPARASQRGIEGAPTLVVEILSPSTAQTDRHTKMQLYARHGVPWYWIVDPDSRTVEVYALGEGGYALSTRVAGDEQLSAEPLTDLVIPPTSLWA